MTTILVPEISYEFKKPELLVQAMTHKSFSNEQGQSAESHNEKLEFLGDAVLALILSEFLMEIFPTDSEGNLSKKRASLVNETVLAQIAQGLHLSEKILLGKGEVLSQGNQKPRLLASAYEALLGAIFIDGGYDSVKPIVLAHFKEVLKTMDTSEDFYSDFKTRLQEAAQADLKATPIYEVTGEQGPSHNPQFEVSLFLASAVVAKGSGRSKKNAEQEAARAALANWSVISGQMSSPDAEPNSTVNSNLDQIKAGEKNV